MGRASKTVSTAPDGETVAPDAGSAQKLAMLAWMQAIAPYGILTTDTDLVVRSWNQWLVAHGNQSAEDVIGRPLTDVFPDLRERRLDEQFRRALDGEASVLSTALHKYLLPFRAPIRSEGTHMLQTARIAPLILQGRIVGTIATIEDVTQRETQALILRRQQEHDRLLSSSLALLLASETPLQVATELFPKIAGPLKLEAYFNYLLSPDGSELRLHACGGVAPEVRKAMAVLKVGEGPGGQVAQLRVPVVISEVQSTKVEHFAPLRRMGLKAYVGFPLIIGDRLLGTLSFGSYDRDAIERDEVEFLSKVAQYLAFSIDRALREGALRQAQQSLSEHAENLENRIAERTAKLHETIVQLESFSYTVAHDLRAPIRSLKGFSEILINDYADSIPELGQEMLQRLLRASNRLDALTRDLLQFSRIVRQDVQLGPVDVIELVRDIVIVTPALQDGVLSMDGMPALVSAQRTLLQQCFSNLFDNALKFVRPGLRPRITVWMEGRGGPPPEIPSALSAASTLHLEKASNRIDTSTPWPADAGPPPRIRIWVEDNGIGIPAQAYEKIFGIFERVSGLEHVEGTGIGLAIVARAMQQMGGACGVESELGKGSQFWLELAAAPST